MIHRADFADGDDVLWGASLIFFVVCRGIKYRSTPCWVIKVQLMTLKPENKILLRFKRLMKGVFSLTNR